MHSPTGTIAFTTGPKTPKIKKFSYIITQDTYKWMSSNIILELGTQTATAFNCIC